MTAPRDPIEATLGDVPTLPAMLDPDRLRAALRMLGWWPDDAIDEVARGIGFAYSAVESGREQADG